MLVGRPFPLSMIVGDTAIKQALTLCILSYRAGGAIICGRTWMAKSVMSRALHSLLPPIEVIEGIPLNVDPDDDLGIDDFTCADIAKGGTPLAEGETEIIATPLWYVLA